MTHTLKCSGICDAVEFIKSPDGVCLHGREGKWIVRPVEYKHGRQKKGKEDELQLCAQAICLEEMLCCGISDGDLFYGQPHRRTQVVFTKELRGQVYKAFDEMGTYAQKGYTPGVKRTKACESCSLKNLCMPELEEVDKVNDYILRYLEDV